MKNKRFITITILALVMSLLGGAFGHLDAGRAQAFCNLNPYYQPIMLTTPYISYSQINQLARQPGRVIAPGYTIPSMTLNLTNIAYSGSVPGESLHPFYGETGEHVFFYSYIPAGYYRIEFSKMNPGIDPDLNIYIVYDNRLGFTIPDNPLDWPDHVDGADISGVAAEKIMVRNGGGRYVPNVEFRLMESAQIYLDVYGNQNIDYSCADPLNNSDYKFRFSLTSFSPTPTPTLPVTPTPTPTPGNRPDRFEPNNVDTDTWAASNPYFQPNTSLDGLTITANDVDIFRTKIGEGRYALQFNVSHPAVALGVRVLITPSAGGTPQEYVIKKSGVVPSVYFVNPDTSADLKVEVSGLFPSADYSVFGTYSMSLKLIPMGTGVEDDYEPNDTPALATPIYLGGKVGGLTLFSNRASADVDWFKLVVPKDADFHCEAVPSSPMLDLAIIGNVEGATDYGNVPRMRVEVNQNYISNRPRVIVNNAPTGLVFYFKVVVEKPQFNGFIGDIRYDFVCNNGDGRPDKPAPTAAPSQVAVTPSGSSGGSSNGSPSPTPSPTPTSDFNSDSVTLRVSTVVPSVKPTSTAENQYFWVTFNVYSDYNRNGQVDAGEVVKGLRILVVDSRSKVVVSDLYSSDSGKNVLTLPGSPAQYSYEVPLLNINRSLPRQINKTTNSVEVDIAIPSVRFPVVIP